MKSLFKINLRLMFIFLSFSEMALFSSCKVTSTESNTASSTLENDGSGSDDNDSLSDTTEPIDIPIIPPVEQKIEGFSEACYLERYPDVKQAWVVGKGEPAVSHYINFGQSENRIPGCYPSPVSSFDEKCYLEKNADVAEQWVKKEQRIPVEHYILFGRSENRKMTCLPTVPDLNPMFVVQRPAEIATNIMGKYSGKIKNQGRRICVDWEPDAHHQKYCATKTTYQLSGSYNFTVDSNNYFSGPAFIVNIDTVVCRQSTDQYGYVKFNLCRVTTGESVVTGVASMTNDGKFQAEIWENRYRFKNAFMEAQRQ